MPKRQILDDSLEAERIAALRSFGILDTAPEIGFDDIVLLASQICETPVSLVSFVDADRQWFKATAGFAGSETPLDQSVCAYAIQQDAPLVIPDLTMDARTSDNALVTEGPRIRFYAGAQLTTQEGVNLGALCVIDTAPRPEGLTPTQLASLQALARQVMAQMELRKLFAAQAMQMAERLTAEEAARRRQELLAEEMGHRLKNILTIVQAIALQTLRASSDVAVARAALMQRIAALAEAHKILYGANGAGADIGTLIASALTPHDYAGDSQFKIAGPTLQISEKAALMFVLMIHELATNATKYGALSTRAGRVSIGWSVFGAGDAALFSFEWREMGGPPVAKPSGQGFGTRLIERALAGTVRGEARLDYASDGLVCRLNATLAGLTEVASEDRVEQAEPEEQAA